MPCPRENDEHGGKFATNMGWLMDLSTMSRTCLMPMSPRSSLVTMGWQQKPGHLKSGYTLGRTFVESASTLGRNEDTLWENKQHNPGLVPRRLIFPTKNDYSRGSRLDGLIPIPPETSCPQIKWPRPCLSWGKAFGMCQQMGAALRWIGEGDSPETSGRWKKDSASPQKSPSNRELMEGSTRTK